MCFQRASRANNAVFARMFTTRMKTMEKMTDVWLEYAFKQYGKSERLKVHMVICNKLIFEALTIRGKSMKHPSPARMEAFA